MMSWSVGRRSTLTCEASTGPRSGCPTDAVSDLTETDADVVVEWMAEDRWDRDGMLGAEPLKALPFNDEDIGERIAKLT